MIPRNVSYVITEYHLLQQRDDHINTYRPFYHLSFEVIYTLKCFIFEKITGNLFLVVGAVGSVQYRSIKIFGHKLIYDCDTNVAIAFR